MKTNKPQTLLLAAITLLAASCKEDEPDPSLTGSTEVGISYNPGKKSEYVFISGTTWTITGYDATALNITPTSGDGGTNTLNIAAAAANCTNADKSYKFTISSGSGSSAVTKEITATQSPVFEIETTDYELDASGGTVTILFNTELDLDSIGLMCNDTFDDMYDDSSNARERSTSADLNQPGNFIQPSSLIRLNAGSVGTRASQDYEYQGTFKIKANTTGASRIGIVVLCDYNNTKFTSEYIVIRQASNISDDYQSTDYSQDGKVYTMQSHSKGSKGYKIIFMGEGFVDKDIADSTYMKAMEEGKQQLFAQEPMKSLYEYCDVYYVNAVSSQDMSNTNHKTAFSCKFATDGGSQIEGDDEAVYEYATKAVAEKDIDNAMIIVLINSTTYGGTTYLYYGDKDEQGGVAQGMSIAFLPLCGDTYASSGVSQLQILQHEAVGHGIGKLADEYAYEKTGAISTADLDTLISCQDTYKMFLNVTSQSDVTKSPWADFAADAAYSGESLGCYEGAYTYTKGIYRPVDNGLMYDGDYMPGPERMLVYKRVIAVASGYDWTYSYDTFKEFDAAGRAEYAAQKTRGAMLRVRRSAMLPLSRPKVIKHKMFR